MKYRVTGHVTISVTTIVEAETQAEARRKARLAPMASLCYQCERGEDDEWSPGGGLDGEVTIPRNGVEEES